MKIKDKLKKIVDSKYFAPCFVIAINAIIFIICNIVFELRYETLDDFTIMKIISKLDGTYSIYSVHIHPILSFIIMMLYKTGININWYTITMLLIQFISFTTIGIILLNKDKKIGTILYLIIASTFYTRVLCVINFTSVASVAILAGIIALMYSLDKNSKKSKIAGYILLTIGVMLRGSSFIIVFPFYMIYSIYYYIKNKNLKVLKTSLIVVIIFITVYISNLIIYKVNPVYDRYTQFNNIRTYFFDYNVLDYEKDKELLDKCGWTDTDYQILYTYSLTDENFYTTENLENLKENVNINLEDIKDKAIYTLKMAYSVNTGLLLNLFIGICLLLVLSMITKNKRLLISAFFILFIILNYVLIYIKPVFRVIISLYATTFVMMSYLLTESNLIGKDSKSKIEKIILIFIVIFYMMLDCIYVNRLVYHKRVHLIIKDVIAYTDSHKENAYVYSNIFQNFSRAFSIYEKLPDNTFSNLRHMSDWDIYDQEYYNFKERYNLDNIMEDLYKKDNLYIITGDVVGADELVYQNHIDLVKEYIENHYNKHIGYDVVKEFSDSVKIYKMHEIK